MKPKRPASPAISLQAENAVSSIYQKIVQRMEELDQLHAEYKVKQEEHFLRTFMSVLEKMGNDLILAQEAYRNVDLQARKDNYCLLLAQELSFFKQQAYSLRDTLAIREKELSQMKSEKEAVDSELQFISQGFESKVKECFKLKAEIVGLKKQIKFLSDPQKHSIFNFTNPEVIIEKVHHPSTKKSLSLANYLEEGSLQLKPIGNRLLMTNARRRKNNSQTLQVKSRPLQNGVQLQFPLSSRKQQASTHSSFRKKLISQHMNRTALHSYQPTPFQ